MLSKYMFCLLSLRAQRSNPEIISDKPGLLRCARNDNYAIPDSKTKRPLLDIIFLLFLSVLLLSCTQAKASPLDYSIINDQQITGQKDVPIYQYKIIKTYPHDTSSFTEGLVFHDGYLYESTGLNQQSKLRRIQLETGKVLQEYKLPSQYFGEGITILNNKIYQLTYTSGTGFVYDKNSFKLQKTFYYDGEGWGLTTDGKQLIMSNGSAILTFRDPKSFAIKNSVTVHNSKEHISLLNELEYIDGKIYANVWQTNYIVIISPKNGQVIGWIDLTSLKAKADTSQNSLELNGIAYDDRNKLLLVTGKDWSTIYAIQLISS